MLTVLIGARAAVQRQQLSDGDAPGVGHRIGELELTAILVDAHRGVLLAVGLLQVVAGIVVDLVVARRIRAGEHLLRLELDAGALEVVVVVDVDAGLNLAREVPLADVFDIGPHQTLGRDERELRIARGVLGSRIGQDKSVVAVRVPEVVVDAFFLHQPADEVEVGLAVLHAVGPLAVGLRQLELEVGRSMIAEHLAENVGDLHLLEDAAVRRARQKPQPRPDDRKVAIVTAQLAAAAEAGDIAVEVTDAVVGPQQLHRDDLAQNAVEIDVLLAQEVDLVLADAAQLLARVHAVEQQVLAKRRGDLHDSRHERLHAWRAPPGRRRAHPPPSAAPPGRCRPAAALPQSPARHRRGCARSGRDD